MRKEIATQEDLLEILNLLESLGIAYWLDGGWGVDALFGQQTRSHRDIDIDFDDRYEEKLLDALFAAGYEMTTDWRPVRLEFYHPERSYLDVHPFVLEEGGGARQANPEGGWYAFEADYFGRAVFAGREIPCISAKGQEVFHTGYELRETDLHDRKLIEILLKREKG